MTTYDCCANCLRPEGEHTNGRCPAPYTTIWHAWDYDFAPGNDAMEKARLAFSAGQIAGCAFVSQDERLAEDFRAICKRAGLLPPWRDVAPTGQFDTERYKKD